ncbi:MAG: TerB family tellurite resistance protein, partial [Bacteroidetes bacterium]|nr:TerB family tellurite resistance protein [Bacteroidota bacterium]
RLERLYDLSRMVYADHIADDHQQKLLHKIAVGLGFSAINVRCIVDKALNLVKNGDDLDLFIDGIKNMNR